jgi:DNA-binding response OmpR family regulator
VIVPTGRYILVISDDSSIDNQLRRALTPIAPDCTVEVVCSRMEVEAAPTPSLILLDLMLSQEQPFDLLSWLRTESRYTGLPVFVLGSKVLSHDVDRAFALGANSCLLKDSEQHGLAKIVPAIAAYASLIGKFGCPTCA